MEALRELLWLLVCSASEGLWGSLAMARGKWWCGLKGTVWGVRKIEWRNREQLWRALVRFVLADFAPDGAHRPRYQSFWPDPAG